MCRGRASFADVTYYTAPSGAGVFATGTLWWERQLGPLCRDDDAVPHRPVPHPPHHGQRARGVRRRPGRRWPTPRSRTWPSWASAPATSTNPPGHVDERSLTVDGARSERQRRRGLGGPGTGTGAGGPCTVSVLMSDDPERHRTPTPATRPTRPPEPSAADIRTLRLQKLDRLRAEGETVYPYRFDRDRTLGELRAEFDSLDDGEETEVEVRVAGRLMLKREQGRLTFAHAPRPRRRGAAVRLARACSARRRSRGFNDLDRGDWVGVDGTVMVTRKGELSVKVTRVRAAVQGPAPAARQVEGPERHRPALPPALRRPRRQRRGPARSSMVRIAAVARHPRPAARPGLPRGRDARAQPGAGRRHRPALRHPLQRARHRHLPAHRASSCRSSGCSSAAWRRSSRSAASSATRASTPATTPSSRCSRAYEAFVDYTEMMALARGPGLLGGHGRHRHAPTVERAGPGDRPGPALPPGHDGRAHRRATPGVDVHPSMPVDDLRAVLDGLGISLRPEVGAGPARHASSTTRRSSPSSIAPDVRASTTRARSRRWPSPTATTRPWSSGSSSSSAAASWPTPTAS